MRVLIVKLSALGDVINSLPVSMAIHAQRPEAVVDWLVESPNAGILAGHPALNEVLVSPRHGPRGGLTGRLARFARELRGRRYDVVLDLQGLMKSAIFVKFSRADRKIGFRGGKEPLAAWALTERLPAYDPERHALERYLDLLAPLGLERPARSEFGLAPTPADTARARALLEGSGQARPLVLLHPMAKWESKLWPVAHWVHLARLLAGAGFDLALTGSGQDKAVTGAMAGALRGQTGLAGSMRDLAGQADLKTLAALQSLAAAVVSTDTGTMHLAAALGTPVVALFGPTSARRTGPYGPGHQVLSLGLGCQPCFRRRCPRPRCLEELPPANAARAVMEIVERQPPGVSHTAGDSNGM